VVLLRKLRARVRLSTLRLILDAGAASSHQALGRLHRFYKVVFLIRAPRRPAYIKARKPLPKKVHFAHPRTLRRWVLVRDAELLVTPSHLLVVLAFDRRRAWLRPLVQQFNAVQVALPWFGERRVAMGFAARSPQLPDALLMASRIRRFLTLTS
jgi:hypothetical protein